MIKFKRLTIALAALLITSATAWAQTTVTWDSNTWGDWAATSVKTHTVDGVTITTGGDAYAVRYNGNLYIYATGNANNLTFSSDTPITRIEMTKATPSTNLRLTPNDGWSVSSDGTTVTWEGTATKSLVCETCTLTVSKIKFYLESTVDLTEVTPGKQWKIASMPAGNVTLNVEYEPELTATFKALTANTIQGGKATVTLTDNTQGAQPQTQTLDADGKLTPVYEGQTITLTAQTGYKFRSVTAKKGGGLLSLQIGGAFTATIYYVEGETWKQAITNHPTENAGWGIYDEGDVHYDDGNNGAFMFTNGNWTNGDTLIDPNASYAFELL